MLKVPDNFEEMKWSCARGEIATNDAAKKGVIQCT
jgi:hypothetical protein